MGVEGWDKGVGWVTGGGGVGGLGWEGRRGNGVVAAGLVVGQGGRA